eukprot:Rhum_TRINITY_DN13812_c0_g1::Rhum_TRINITY_DN13812_c0_g1_i1::g.64590::m.64590
MPTKQKAKNQVQRRRGAKKTHKAPLGKSLLLVLHLFVAAVVEALLLLRLGTRREPGPQQPQHKHHDADGDADAERPLHQRVVVLLLARAAEDGRRHRGVDRRQQHADRRAPLVLARVPGTAHDRVAAARERRGGHDGVLDVALVRRADSPLADGDAGKHLVRGGAVVQHVQLRVEQRHDGVDIRRLAQLLGQRARDLCVAAEVRLVVEALRRHRQELTDLSTQQHLHCLDHGRAGPTLHRRVRRDVERQRHRLRQRTSPDARRRHVRRHVPEALRAVAPVAQAGLQRARRVRVAGAPAVLVAAAVVAQEDGRRLELARHELRRCDALVSCAARQRLAVPAVAVDEAEGL